MKTIENPIVDFNAFSMHCREEGISGFIRARNEGEFLAKSIESWLPLLDELIIVYNNCQDNTGKIALDYEKKYPDKIKVFHYLPIVYGQGTEQYNKLDSNSPHSLVNYYNFALSKTTKKWALKIDGDLILVKEKISTLKNYYEKLRDTDPNAFLPISGINLISQGKRLYVPYKSKFSGIYGDICLFRVDSDSVFKKGNRCEYLDLSERKQLKNIFACYHLKFIKSDFGIGNYDFENNPNSKYVEITIRFLYSLKLIPLENILQETNMPTISAEELEISFTKSYRKDAMKYFKKSINKHGGGGYITRKYIWIKLKDSKFYTLLRKIKYKLIHSL